MRSARAVATALGSKQPHKAQASRRTFTKMAPEVRRQQLIEAAFRSLCLHGYAGTSVRSIAQMAGLSLGMVRFHFKTKGELLAATTQHLSEQFQAAAEKAIVEAGPDPGRQLRAMLTVGLRPPILSRDYVQARYILWSASETDTVVRQAHEVAYGKFGSRLRQLIRNAAPGTPTEAEIASVALLTTAFLKGIWVEWLLSPPAVDPVLLVDRFSTMLDGHLRALSLPMHG